MYKYLMIINAMKLIIKIIMKPLLYLLFLIKYRIKNKNNRTLPKYPKNWVKQFDLDKVIIWKDTYWILDIRMSVNKNEFLKIWNYCSIADGVEFFTWWNHVFTNFTTYPIGILNGVKNAEIAEDFTNWPIIIDDDVWIGTWAKIMSWVHIGQWAVIAAWSIVTKDVEPYSIAWWIPAKIIKYRFSEDIINILKKVDFNKITPEKMIKNYEVITSNPLNIEKIKEIFL